MISSFRSLTIACLASALLAGSATAQHMSFQVRIGDESDSQRSNSKTTQVALHNPSKTLVREVRSELMADTQRAEKDLRRQVEVEIARWLADDGIPLGWLPPKRMIDKAIVGKVFVEPVQVADLTVFRASVETDFSPARKRALIDAYHRQEGGRRLAYFGGGLVLILSVLAGVSGYIRADEATKGYYTNPLRLLAAAGVGATGVVVYQILT